MAFLGVFIKVTMLVIVILTGYLSAKVGWIKPEFKKYATPVTLNVFVSCLILNSILNTTLELGGGDLVRFLLLTTLVIAVCGGLGWLSAAVLKFPAAEAGIARMAVMFPNNINIGVPVVQAIFGAEAVFYMSLTNIPFTVLLYTVGVMQLDGKRGQKFDWRVLLSAPLIACVAGIFLFTLRLEIPQLILDCVSMMGAAAIPMVLVLLGASLAEIPLKSALSDWRAYAVCLIRLLVCPAVFWLIFRGLVADPVVLGVLIAMAACPCAVMLSTLSIQRGLDDAFAARTILISTVLSTVTMPLIISVLL